MYIMENIAADRPTDAPRSATLTCRQFVAYKLLLLTEGYMPNYRGQPPKKPYELKARDLFARRLEAARTLAGYESKAAGARALGMEAATYERWERAETAPDIYWLGRISHVFKIPLDSLIPAYKDPAAK
jgi:hypothetical protein